nr:unnamed protein product [Callosobruchus chinensis]
MILLIIASCLSFLSVHSSFIGTQVLKWLSKPSSKEKQLLSKKRELILQQSSFSMANSFVQYSKIQRRINSIDEELAINRNSANNWTLQFGLLYGTKIVLGVTLIALSVYYRHTPLFTVDINLDLTPFSYIISYPCETNAITLHFWILCCTAVAKLIKL